MLRSEMEARIEAHFLNVMRPPLTRINSNDALDILRYSTGASKFSATQLKAGDLNRDGKVNSNDALIVLSISTGKTSTANY